ncbi:MAG: DNA polymerase III subunit alpha, partial [Pseudomonadota bacterium]
LDPIRFGLLFERFLNPDRVSMPDFDIDFCQDRRDEVIRYVQSRYGAEKVASIITFGKLQARAVLRDVGRVMGLPFGLVDKICKLVPFNPANPPTLDQALEMEPRLQAWRQDDEAVDQMIEVALKLEGLPRHASTHAAGVVIGDRPLDELIPLYRDPRAMMPVTQFNMKDVEKAGLVKFDFLGLTTLTLLRMAEDMVKARGTPLELEKLELDDPGAYAILSKADTAGVFQLESSGMRDALKKLKADCFEDIIAMVSLYRPGPMDNIPRYIAVKHGQEEPAYLHPRLKPILEETNGVIIYQEQVMEIAKQLAGYTLGGADLLRRAMGKKIQAEMDAQREVFVNGAMERDIDEGLANTIFDQVAKFASYGFNKSHAAAYALLAYHTAYLKANHTVEFYCAVMTMDMANHEKLAMFRQEMINRGIPSYRPDVNHSDVLFKVEDGVDGTGVRHALAAIKGVGRQAMASLVSEREAAGPYADIFDLTARLGPKVLNKRILEGLIRAGALDGFDDNRCRLMESLDQVVRFGAACQDMDQGEQESLFTGGDAVKPTPPALTEAEDWPQLERLQHEFVALGFYMSAHPLDGYKNLLDRLGAIPAADIRAHLAFNDSGRIKIAGVVLGKQERNSARGRFAFVQLSDTSAQYEATLYAEILNDCREMLEGNQMLLLEVDARTDGDELRLIVYDATPLDEAEQGLQTAVEIELATIEAAPSLKPYLQVNGSRAARVRLVVPTDGVNAVVSLPEPFGLPLPSRMDVERLEGVVGIRDLA